MPAFPSPDSVLDRLLAALDVGVTHFTVCDIRDGWSMGLDAGRAPTLHYCLEGTGTLTTPGSASISLEPHTFVLLPPGVAYRIESASPKASQIEQRTSLCGASSYESVPTLTVGDGEQGIVTVCGEIRMGLAGGANFFFSFGEPLVARFGCGEGLQNQFVMLLAESTRPGIGTRPLTEALLKQCLILALRRWVECEPSPFPWLAAMADQRLSRALHAIFEQPAVAYTVDSLAVMAGMSRSAFAAAFRRTFGQSPMSLVKLVRLRRASELLITTTLPVSEVAKRVGFSSRSNFSVAFSELHDMDPSRFRHTFSTLRKTDDTETAA